MCRSIKTLFNQDPPATEEEIQAAALQFVRKVSGFRQPSRANDAAFSLAVEDITRISSQLLAALETATPPRNRLDEAERAARRAARRFS